MTVSLSEPLPPGQREWDLEPKLEIWVESRTVPVVVTLAGELTGSVAGQLRSVLAPLITTAGGSVVLDMSDVGFIDAGGIGVLAGARHRARARRSGWTVVNPRPSIRRILETAGLGDLLSAGAPDGR